MSEKPTVTPPFDGNAIQVLLNTGKGIGAAMTPTGLQPYAVIPEGWKSEPLEWARPKPLDPLPDHIREAVKIRDWESFVAYVNLYKGSATRIFATPLNLREFTNVPPKFLAIIDYHSTQKDGDVPQHARKGHTAKFECALSEELRVWLGRNTARVNQFDFVDFIESNTPDITFPKAAEIMQMALNFSQKSTVTFVSALNRTNGGRELAYEEKIDDGGGKGKITVPEMMKLLIPIFEGGKKFEITARLEYRADKGELKIAYHLQRLQDVFREAFKGVRADIEAGIEIPIITGEPLGEPE